MAEKKSNATDKLTSFRCGKRPALSVSTNQQQGAARQGTVNICHTTMSHNHYMSHNHVDVAHEHLSMPHNRQKHKHKQKHKLKYEESNKERTEKEVMKNERTNERKTETERNCLGLKQSISITRTNHSFTHTSPHLHYS